MAELKTMWVVALLALVPWQSSGLVLLGADLADGFYGEAPPFAVDRAEWLGLVADDRGHVLAHATLEWRTLDAAPGADGPRFELVSDLERPLLFLSEIDGLRTGPVRAATPRATDLSPGTPRVELGLGDIVYEMTLESAYPDECGAVVTISDGSVAQRIEVQEVLGCGDPHFTVHWAGDLDADGALDLVATFSMKYSYHPRQLFLSSAAGPQEIVGLAAVTERTAS